MSVRIRRDAPTKAVQFGKTLTSVSVRLGLPPVGDLKDELLYYMDVLLGRAECPIESPYLAMQEVATAYHARACEIDMLIHEAEREGVVAKKSDLYQFRTGALRSFIDASGKMAALGSRRLEQEKLLYQARLER